MLARRALENVRRAFPCGLFQLLDARGVSDRLGDVATRSGAQSDLAAVTDDMLSRVLRTLSSDDWV